MWTLSPASSALLSCSTSHCSCPPGSVLLINNQLWWGRGSERERGVFNVNVLCSDIDISQLTSFHCYRSLFEERWLVALAAPPHCRTLPCNYHIIKYGSKFTTYNFHLYLIIVCCACFHSGSLDSQCPQSCMVGSSSQSRLCVPVMKGGGKLFTGTLSWLPNVG